MCDECDYSGDEDHEPVFLAGAVSVGIATRPIRAGEFLTARDVRDLRPAALPPSPVRPDVRPAWRITAGEYRAFGLGVAVTLFLYGLQALL